MKIQVEEVAPCVKALKIEVPQDVVAERCSLAFSQLYKTAQIAGFRPGKSPRALIEKRYGAALREDVIRDLIRDHYDKALKEAALHPIRHLGFEDIRAEANAPLSFTAKMEVMPTFPELHYTGLRVPRRTVNVSEADVEVALTQAQDRQGIVESWPEDHLVDKGDVVTISYVEMTQDNPLSSEAQTHTVNVGAGTTLEAIELALMGKRNGETFEVGIPQPPDAVPAEGTDGANASVAVKGREFSVTITTVQKKTLPPIDDDLARDEAYESLAAMRVGLRQQITAQAESRQAQAQKNLLIAQVVAAHTFDLPPSMVDMEIHGLIEQEEKEGGSDGGAHEHPHMPDVPHGHDALHQKYEPIARRRLKTFFLLQAVAEAEKIRVSDQDFDAFIDWRATHFGLPPDDLRKIVMENKKLQTQYALEIREEKTLNRILSLAQFDDAEMTAEVSAIAAV